MKMLKKTILLLALSAMTLSAQAQIYMVEGDENNRYGTETELGVVPQNGVYNDQANAQFTPLGEGLMMLAAFGGAYLLRKRKRNNQKVKHI